MGGDKRGQPVVTQHARIAIGRAGPLGWCGFSDGDTDDRRATPDQALWTTHGAGRCVVLGQRRRGGRFSWAKRRRQKHHDAHPHHLHGGNVWDGASGGRLRVRAAGPRARTHRLHAGEQSAAA